MMKYALFVVIFIFCLPATVAGSMRQDSLLSALQSTTLPKERIAILRNLADLCFEKPEEIGYLKQLCREARSVNDREPLIEAMGGLSQAYLKGDKVDSSFYYVSEIQAYDDLDYAQGWIAYMAMRLFNYYTLQSNQELQINEKLKELDQQIVDKHNEVYQQIKYSFILGIGLFSQEKFKESVPHFETASTLAQKLPIKVGFNIILLTTRYYARSLAISGQNHRTIELSEQLLKMEYDYFAKNYAKQRPFFPVNSYYSSEYTSLMINVSFLPSEKQQHYLKQILVLCSSSDNDYDRYNYFLSLNNYYMYRKNSAMALAMNDSLIKIAHRIAPYNLEGLYQVSVETSVGMKEYEKAYNYLQLAFAAKDSMNKELSKMELEKFQVQYGVDKLNYEKSQLENKNKQIILIGLVFFLCVVICVCVYLFRNLKREKRMKARMGVLMLKAEESEKMKTAFINSICHEVRTPLNSIVGFTDLVLDEELEPELRKTFPEEIRRSTFTLISLIDSMLEVSNLDVSNDPLPCSLVNINQLIGTKMDELQRHHKPGIDYRSDLPSDEIVVSTNQRYLALVVDHLLENANKFTERGEIALHCRIETDRLTISVSDTGCGIPPDRHQQIFDRFTKLDEHKQGSGLGLYLCNTIIRRLNGEISVDPTYSGGTRFVISLPVSKTT